MVREKNDHQRITDKAKQQRISQTDISERMRQEESIQERIDQEGIKWRKLYFGGGAHFRNWLSQCIEIYGEENIAIEDVDPTGFRCFEKSDEKMHRIWVKEGRDTDELFD
jgi:hypothetical protein